MRFRGMKFLFTWVKVSKKKEARPLGDQRRRPTLARTMESGRELGLVGSSEGVVVDVGQCDEGDRNDC